MKITETAIPDVKILVPDVFRDHRGYFFEDRRTSDFDNNVNFVQGNVSNSLPWVLRGIHYQINQPVGKLVRVLQGGVYAVAVDLRRSSPTFKKWVGAHLNAGNAQALYVPPGFGNSFLALDQGALVHYDCTGYHVPEWDRTLNWSDPELSIAWPLSTASAPFNRHDPILSNKDRAAPFLHDAELP